MSSVNKHGLGRGLSALLGDEDLNLDLDFLEDEKNGLKMIKIVELHAGKFQPRKNFDEEQIKSLAESIKEKGILQPLLVRKDFEGYEIIAGERRYRAAILAGVSEVPVIEKELSDVETLEIALIENIVRQDLNDIEEALGFANLIDNFSYTQEKIAQTVGKSRSYVANSFRLLTLSDEIKYLLNENLISAGHARCLIGCENALFIAQKIVEEGLNVRQTEELVAQLKNPERKHEKIKKVKDTDLVAIEKNLTKKIGLKVQINTGKNGKGKVILNYKDLSELENIINKLES